MRRVPDWDFYFAKNLSQSMEGIFGLKVNLVKGVRFHLQYRYDRKNISTLTVEPNF